jgi:hypothetical protein
MSTRRLTALTIANLVILGLVLLLPGLRSVRASGAPSVIRGSALEIVDEEGRVRASIKVQPAEVFKPTGKAYPETVVLRLIDPAGRPEVKIAASQNGGGLSLVGDTDTTQVLLKAEGPDSSLRLTNKTGKQQLIVL